MSRTICFSKHSQLLEKAILLLDISLLELRIFSSQDHLSQLKMLYCRRLDIKTVPDGRKYLAFSSICLEFKNRFHLTKRFMNQFLFIQLELCCNSSD